MRGDAMTNFDSNPYSPPTDEPRAKPGTTHYEFQFTDKGIRCRSRLEIPKVCLVTGATENLAQHRMGTIQFVIFGIAIFCPKGVVISYLHRTLRRRLKRRMWIRSSRRESRSDYPGVALKAIGYQSGQFEIAGFTPEYLETLQRQRGNV